MTTTKIPVNLRLPQMLLERIDYARGSQNRTAWMIAALEAALGDPTDTSLEAVREAKQRVAK